MNNNTENQKTPGNDKQTQQPTPAQAEKMRSEIKKTWSKLSDEDVKLYDRQEDLFFKRIKEKHDINAEDARKKLDELKVSCGCGASKAA